MEEVWANALLSDGEILFWYTGSECKDPYEFYKDFYYSHINMIEYGKSHKLEIAKMKFVEENGNDNYLIFNVLAPNFYRNYKISPDSKGKTPY